MELDLTTFLLELVNFLILIGLLKHFLYRPVLSVIEKRRAAVQASLDDADATRQQAENARLQYQRRLDAWEQERRHARDKLHEDIQQEKNRLLDEAKREVAAAQRQVAVRAEQEKQEAQRKQSELARHQGVTFASRLLSRLAGPELERLLVNIIIEDLDALSSERLAELQQEDSGSVRVWSAYPLSDVLQKNLEKSLGRLVSGGPDYQYEQLPELLAGVRVQLGPWMLQANLKDELAYFAEWDRNGP